MTNNVLCKYLAVVGFSEYRSRIEYVDERVDGWFAEDDPEAEEYDIVIEKAGGYIRARETYGRRSAFLVNCRKEHLPEALQSLVILLNNKNYIGMDAYDVFSSMPRVVDFFLCEIAGDACLDGMRSAVEPDLEYIREHPEEEWVTWAQLEGDRSVMPDWELLLEVMDKLNTLTDGLLEFACSVPVIEKQKSLAAAFWLPAPEENTGPEN